MPTEIQDAPTGITVEPCTCECAHKTVEELLSDTCACGCDCHSPERIARLKAEAERLGVGLGVPAARSRRS